MKKRIIIIIVALLSLLPLQSQAQTIDITFNGTEASVTIPAGVTDVTSAVSGANVTLLSTTTSTEYTYRVKGTSSDGSLLISGSYKLTLQLAGVDLTNAHGGAAIDVECGKRIAVELVEGTSNTLADVAGAQKAALYFKGHPEFEGAGILNVTGNAKHAIAAKEYMELKSSTGTINVLGAVSDGLHCGKAKQYDENNYFLMKGGTVNISNVGGDGIDADDYGVVNILGGTVSVNVGNDADGLKADSTVNILGGIVNIAVSGTDSEGISAHHTINISGGETSILVTGNGSKGIKAKQETDDDASARVKNGGFLCISGGNIAIQTLAGSYVDPVEGTTSKCMGISVDADMTMTDGSVALTALGPDAYSYHVKGSELLQGGTLNVVRTPWTTNAYDYQYDMTVYAAIENSGEPLADYRQVAVGAFIGDECVGYGIFTDDGYGIIRVRSHQTVSQPVTFRLYDYATERSYDLTPSQTVSFQSTASMGTPSSPVVLSYTPSTLKGDVNGDGKVDVTDVTAIINIILHKATTGLDTDAADVNGNGTVDVTDVTATINIILHK